MKQIFNVIFVIIAALIGAGFASGQEINVFFYQYGIEGLIGLAICSMLFAVIIYRVFKIVKANNIDSYGDFVHALVGERARQSKVPEC